MDETDKENKPSLFDRMELKQRKPNYSEKEIIYYLEILPINRKSVIIKNKK